MSYPKQTIRFRPYGGIVTDLPANELGDEFWSDGLNVRHTRGAPERVYGWAIAYAYPSVSPVALLSIQRPGSDFWVYAGGTTQWCVNADGHTDITIAGGLTEQLRAGRHSLCSLNGVAVHNNSLNPPMYWPGSITTPFLVLPDWPANNTCQKMVSHLYHLFALDIDAAGERFTSLLRWSDAAEPGTIPDSWTPGLDNQAGSAELSDTPGAIMTAATLRDALLIYKRDGVYVADYVGGDQVYAFRPLFRGVGAISSRAVAAGPQGHLFVSDDDVILTDGNGMRSLVDARIRKRLFDGINQDRIGELFVFYNSLRRETVIAVPSGVKNYPDTLYIYSHDADAWGIWETDAVAAMAEGFIAAAAELPPPPTVEDVTISPPGGTFSAPVEVTLTCATVGAAIHYTNTGAEPTELDPLYTVPTTIVADLWLRARAFMSGMTPSAIASANFDLQFPPAAAPVIVPASGTFTTPQTVTMSTTTPGGVIHYTLDGSVPDVGDPVYTVALDVLTTTTVRAITLAQYYDPSTVSQSILTIDYPNAEAPTILPAGGPYTAPVSVTMTTGTPGGVIHYTVDGSVPDAGDPPYTAPVVLRASATVRAITLAPLYDPSTIAQQVYAIDFPNVADPVFDPPGGTYVDSVEVTLSCATPGALIYYTTDGNVPDETDTLYTGPVTVLNDVAPRARAFLADYDPSQTVQADYVISGGGVVPYRWTFDNTTLGWTGVGGNFVAAPGAGVLTQTNGTLRVGSPDIVGNGDVYRYCAVRARFTAAATPTSTSAQLDWMNALHGYSSTHRASVSYNTIGGIPGPLVWFELVIDIWSAGEAADYRGEPVTGVRWTPQGPEITGLQLDIEWIEMRPDDGAPIIQQPVVP